MSASKMSVSIPIEKATKLGPKILAFAGKNGFEAAEHVDDNCAKYVVSFPSDDGAAAFTKFIQSLPTGQLGGAQ